MFSPRDCESVAVRQLTRKPSPNAKPLVQSVRDNLDDFLADSWLNDNQPATIPFPQPLRPAA